jgi:hypothetical protein
MNQIFCDRNSSDAWISQRPSSLNESIEPWFYCWIRCGNQLIKPCLNQLARISIVRRCPHAAQRQGSSDKQPLPAARGFHKAILTRMHSNSNTFMLRNLVGTLYARICTFQRHLPWNRHFAPLAQLAEQLTLNQRVAGSIPARCNCYRPKRKVRPFQSS